MRIILRPLVKRSVFFFSLFKGLCLCDGYVQPNRSGEAKSGLKREGLAIVGRAGCHPCCGDFMSLIGSIDPDLGEIGLYKENKEIADNPVFRNLRAEGVEPGKPCKSVTEWMGG